MGRGAALAKTNPAASHPFPPLSHPARREPVRVGDDKEEGLGIWKGCWLLEGHGEKASSQKGRRRSWEITVGQPARRICAVVSLRAGGQAAPRVLGKADKQQVFGCVHQKADAGICAAASHPPVPLPGLMWVLCHLAPSTYTYNLLARLQSQQLIQCPK